MMLPQRFSGPDDVFDADPRQSQRDRGLYSASLISYVLHLIVAVGAVLPGGQWSPTLLVVALVLDFVKRADARDTWHASHFAWRIRSVAWAGLAYLLTAPLWLLFLLPGWLAWFAVSVWFLYRIVQGLLRLNAGRSMEFFE